MKDNVYFFDIIDSNFLHKKDCRYNASQKPRIDTFSTIKEMGIKDIILYSKSTDGYNNRITRRLISEYNKISLLNQYYSLLGKIKNSIILIQYPFICGRKLTLIKKIKKNGNKIILFIHDIESIRQNKNYKLINAEIEILNLSDVCILHSSAMINKLQELGLKSKVVPLEFFDYRSNLEIYNDFCDLKEIKIIFAGNLDKSVFLKELNKLDLNASFQFNLYGKESKNIQTTPFIHYKGKFEADKFDVIQGNWGLVWDGDSMDSCTGNYGEYLKINAPFKASLYIAANKPIITWGQSAIAEYVDKYNLGICVNSIADIQSAINKLQDNKLDTIKESVMEMSMKVKQGNMLRNALEIALSLIC